MLRPSLALVLLLALVSGCGEAGPAERGTSGSGWLRLPDAPLSGRVGASVVALDPDRVLVVGGWEWLCPPTADCGFPDTPVLEDGAIVSLRSGDWAPIAPAPVGLFHSPSVVTGGMVAVLAGGVHEPPGELLVYDPGTDAWDRRAVPRDVCGQLVATGTGFLAICGTDENGELRDRAYDLATDTWTVLPDDPLPPVYDRFGVLDGSRLLVFGSLMSDDQGEAGRVAAALDLASGAWTRLPDAPGHGYQAWGVGDEVWVNPHFGPDGGGVLDLATDTWRPLPTLPADPDLRGDLAGVVGADSAEYEYDHGWIRDTVDGEWVEVPGRGSTAYDTEVTAAGRRLVVFGGQDWGTLEREVTLAGEGELVSELWVWRPAG